MGKSRGRRDKINSLFAFHIGAIKFDVAHRRRVRTVGHCAPIICLGMRCFTRLVNMEQWIYRHAGNWVCWERHIPALVSFPRIDYDRFILFFAGGSMPSSFPLHGTLPSGFLAAFWLLQCGFCLAAQFIRDGMLSTHMVVGQYGLRYTRRHSFLRTQVRLGPKQTFFDGYPHAFSYFPKAQYHSGNFQRSNGRCALEVL